jgi:hypothetical protein
MYTSLSVWAIGLGRGLTFFSWTSDQYSQDGSKAAPSTSRNATYVLDEIPDSAAAPSFTSAISPRGLTLVSVQLPMLLANLHDELQLSAISSLCRAGTESSPTVSIATGTPMREIA